MKKIVVIGGGTVGWLTALYAKKNFPDSNVTLIESDEIGILGAGEGTLTNFVDFVNYLDISFKDLVKHAGATLKSGIKFTNWSDDGGYYYHGFGSNPQDLGSFDQLSVYKTNFFSSEYLFPNIQNKENEIFIDVSEQNKVMFALDKSLKTFDGNMKSLNQYCRYAFHFDARALAKFLSDTGIQRGINLIKGQVVSFDSYNSGDIHTINLDNGKAIKSDFIFDCSGLARLLIGKHFKSEWISFRESLPMKKAIPFFLPIDKDNIPPYTEAIAMDYGWMWKIPLQHRYGCGYVFDSDYISEEEAMNEIESFLGFKPDYPRAGKGAFNFNPGCFDRVLINNVLAVGLSSGFVEPLEATSIAQSIVLLRRFFMHPGLLVERNQDFVEYFNKSYIKDSEFIADFIQMHYLTNKTNTPFWKNFRDNNKISNSLIYRIGLMDNSMALEDGIFSMHSSYSYYSVANGMGLLDKQKVLNTYKDLGFNNFTDKIKNGKNSDLINSFLTHSEFLGMLGAQND